MISFAASSVIWHTGVSAYASEILSQASGGSNLPLEVLEKPISNQVLIDTVEDTATFKELKKFDLNIDAFKKGGFSHEQLRDAADILKNVKGVVELYENIYYIGTTSLATMYQISK